MSQLKPHFRVMRRAIEYVDYRRLHFRPGIGRAISFAAADAIAVFGHARRFDALGSSPLGA